MRKLLLTVGLSIVFVHSAIAHHPFDAEFDRDKPVTLNGTVTRYTWANPHATVYLDASSRQGERREAWTVELAGPAELAKEGWSQTSLKAGDMITVTGWLARDGSRRANAHEVRKADGATLSAASSFYATDSQLAGTPRAETGTSGQLPRTASPLPMFLMLALGSLGGALALARARR